MNYSFPQLAFILSASSPDWLPALARALISTFAFGLVGMLLMVLGFWMLEVATRRLDIESQLAQRNYAVAVMVASMMLGLAWIVVTAMS